MRSHFLHFLSAHGFLIVPLSILLMLIILGVWRKKYPIGSKLAIFLPVFAVINLIWGGTWNARFVYNHGVRGEAVVTKIVPTNTWINDVQVMEYRCLLRTRAGKILNVSFENNGDIFYPQSELWLPPQIGESFTVRYIAGHEENFIIPTDDSKSTYANKLQCMELVQKIASAKATYAFDLKNQTNKKAYVRLVNQYIRLNCDTNLVKLYKIELEELEKR